MTYRNVVKFYLPVLEKIKMEDTRQKAPGLRMSELWILLSAGENAVSYILQH
jgi:hypothetical protein